MPTANYTTEANKFDRRVQWLVEMDLDRCSLNYTTAPCTATDAGNGSRCFYTFATCQDQANFAKTTKTWRFCLANVPWLDTASPAYPYLLDWIAVPQRIDPSKLVTFPEKIKLEMRYDWLPTPMDRDKTLFNTGTPGEFWRVLFARHRNYQGKPVRIKRGFCPPAGVFALADFAQVGPTYKILSIEFDRERCVIECESPLADLNKLKVPFTISDDNTIQNGGGINSSATSVTVRDAKEYPNPADYARFKTYAEIESEIVEITARDTSTQILTIVRARLGTTAASHAQGIKINHVAFFGTDQGASAPTARNVVDCIQDLLDWAGVAAGSRTADSFSKIKAGAWPRSDIKRTVRKPQTVAAMMRQLIESRGIAIYIDPAGNFAAAVVAPDTTSTELTEDELLEGSVSVEEEEEDRITRAGFWYAPTDTDDAGTDPKDYSKGVIVINTTLEGANVYGVAKSKTITDPWIDSGATTSDVRVLVTRMITRFQHGTRRYAFRLDVKRGTLNVGDHVTITSKLAMSARGVADARPCMIVAKREVGLSQNEYEAIDTNFSGRYMRIAPNTVADSYDSASQADRAYGYFGDTNNRLGTTKDEGYIYW